MQTAVTFDQIGTPIIRMFAKNALLDRLAAHHGELRPFITVHGSEKRVSYGKLSGHCVVAVPWSPQPQRTRQALPRYIIRSDGGPALCRRCSMCSKRGSKYCDGCGRRLDVQPVPHPRLLHSRSAPQLSAAFRSPLLSSTTTFPAGRQQPASPQEPDGNHDPTPVSKPKLYKPPPRCAGLVISPQGHRSPPPRPPPSTPSRPSYSLPSSPQTVPHPQARCTDKEVAGKSGPSDWTVRLITPPSRPYVRRPPSHPPPPPLLEKADRSVTPSEQTPASAVLGAREVILGEPRTKRTGHAAEARLA